MDLLFRKQGLPEESDIVICEVTKVYYNSVFVKIIEHDVQGMIHISEISPGRIRNIGDYVKVGKMIICKVLRVNREKGHVDLSLRRVNNNVRREKSEEIKQEQKAEKIVELVANDQKIPKRELYDKVSDKVFAKYGMLYQCFEEVVGDNSILEKLGLDKKVSKALTEIIVQRIKPPVFKIVGTLELQSYAPDGVDQIRKVLVDASKKGDIKYNGAGKYRVEIEADDFKSGESKIAEIADYIKGKFKGELSFKIDKKLKI